MVHRIVPGLRFERKVRLSRFGLGPQLFLGLAKARGGLFVRAPRDRARARDLGLRARGCRRRTRAHPRCATDRAADSVATASRPWSPDDAPRKEPSHGDTRSLDERTPIVVEDYMRMGTRTLGEGSHGWRSLPLPARSRAGRALGPPRPSLRSRSNAPSVHVCLRALPRSIRFRAGRAPRERRAQRHRGERAGRSTGVGKVRLEQRIAERSPDGACRLGPVQVRLGPLQVVLSVAALARIHWHVDAVDMVVQVGRVVHHDGVVERDRGHVHDARAEPRHVAGDRGVDEVPRVAPRSRLPPYPALVGRSQNTPVFGDGVVFE